MANLYGNSNASSGLYGSPTDSLLSPRNAEAAKQLGLPNAVGGREGAGSQIEANDPYANFEDIFNTNRAKGKEMADAGTAKVQETATGEKPQMANGFTDPNQPTMGPATPGKAEPSPQQMKLDPGSISGQIQAAPTLQAKQSVADGSMMSRGQPATGEGWNQAAPTGEGWNQAAPTGEGWNQAAPRPPQRKQTELGGGLLDGFGDAPAGPQQYGGTSGATQLGNSGATAPTAIDQDALDSDVAAPPKRKIVDANGVETDNQGNPVDPFSADKVDTSAPYVNPQTLAPAHQVTALEQWEIDQGRRPAPETPGDLRTERRPKIVKPGDKDFEVGQVGATEDEYNKLDRLTKANKLLDGYGMDNGEALLETVYGADATQWDAAIAGAAGGRDQMSHLQKEYGGADKRYAKELAGTLKGRQQDKAFTEQANAANAGFRKAEADQAALDAAKPKPGVSKGFVPEGYSDLIDFIQGDASVGGAYQQTHAASQKVSPADWFTRALGEAGYDGPMASEIFGKMFAGNNAPEHQWQAANIRTSLDEMRSAYGEDALKWLSGQITAEMWAEWQRLSNPGSISRRIRAMLEAAGFKANGQK